MNPPEPARGGVAAWLWRRPRRWFLLGIPVGGLLALALGIGLSAGFLGALKATSTETFCLSCHEMHTPYQELTRSVHYSNEFGIRAGCADCHIPPGFGPGLIRHLLASTQVWDHALGELDTPARFEAHRLELAQRVWLMLKQDDSAECRSCHTSAAMALAKQPPAAAGAHASLVQNGLTCIDCHTGVAHTLPAGG
jgi:nitrate/TMAO reductase-like tetraheme cytochrome c subunit